MEQLTKLHEQLLKISEDKTEAIKKADTESLVKLLTKERQLIQKVEQLELAREQLVNQFFTENQIQSDERNVTSLLNKLPNKNDKAKLEGIVTQLIQLVVL